MTSNRIQSLEVELRNWRAAGGLEESSYWKCIISLAYEYIVSDEVQKGLQLLMSVPETYYGDQQLSQMREDRDYADLVTILSYKLIQLGLVGDESLPKTTARA